MGFAGGKGESDETKTGTNVEEESYTFKLPLTTKGEKIRVTVPENPIQGVSYEDNLPIWQEMEKITGVDIEWDVIKNEYDTVMKTRIAARIDMPDIFTIPSGIDIKQLAKSRTLLKLDEYIPRIAPHMVTFYDEHPVAEAAMRTPEGEIYVFPQRYLPDYAVKFNPVSHIFRHDWMVNLGIEDAPVTIEDWYSMLKKMRDNDPNGNGEKDEIPFSAYQYGVLSFAEAYGLYPSGFTPDENGKLFYSWTAPEAKMFFKEMNKWYMEELIDPQFLSLNSDQLWGQMLDDKVGSTFQAAATNCDWLNANNKVDPDVDWRAIAPPRGPSGEDPFLITTPQLSETYVGIYAETNVPELAIKFLDFAFASEKGRLLQTMGVANVHYTMVDGKPKYTDAILKPEGKWWENQKRSGIDMEGFPRYLRPEMFESIEATFSAEITDSVDRIEKYLISGIPYIMSTEKEAEVLRRKQADISTYLEEMMAKFITGTESIDNFDNFVKKLSQLGIEEVLEVKNAQYERAMRFSR